MLKNFSSKSTLVYRSKSPSFSNLSLLAFDSNERHVQDSSDVFYTQYLLARALVVCLLCQCDVQTMVHIELAW